MSIRKEHKGTFPIIMSAVNQLVDFVAPTYGPAANKAIIDKNLYRMVVDDGVQIARDFELSDDAENAVVKVIRDVAIRTNDRVGDGTTSSLLMLRGIMQEVEKQGSRNGRVISEELKKAAVEAKDQLLAKAKKISSKLELERVARISFDNPKIAGIISDLLSRIGKEGVITMDQSNTMETTSERVDGIEFKQGFISPYMITDGQRMEAVLEKPHILVTTYRLTNANDVIPVMNKLMAKGIRQAVFIADGIESDALATLIINRTEGKFIGIGIQAPQGEGKEQFLKDVALLTGAQLFTEEKGNRLDQAEIEHLGRADRLISRSNRTIIVGGKGKKSEIEKEKQRIRDAINENPKEHLKQDLEARLARLINGVAVVKVGAPTDVEAKALKYKVEDAINATRSALANGIVCGSGIALSEVVTSSAILNRALQHPFRQLKENMGIDRLDLKKGQAYNAVTGEKGNFMKVGVVDPVDVLIAGIESAVSIACMLVTTHGILVEERPKEENN